MFLHRVALFVLSVINIFEKRHCASSYVTQTLADHAVQLFGALHNLKK